MLALWACAPTGSMRINTADPSFAHNEHHADPADAVSAKVSPADAARLDQLMKQRSSAAAVNQDYPIGPGDVLTITVPDLDEITQRKVRVSSLGTIELPLLGTVQAGGLSEEGLSQELDSHLQKFMFNPQASVFVEEYRNRQVAVVGAVIKPGLVLLDSPSETILDVLTQAGGVVASAADQLILIPVQPGAAGHPLLLPPVPAVPTAGTQVASAQDTKVNSATDAVTTSGTPNAASSGMAQYAQPSGMASALTIPLRSTSLTDGGEYLNMPVRPGDVLVVPGGGQVMVVGWVKNPNHFEVGSGLTVLGAVGAAGGPMYAADTKDVALIRSGKDGSKVTIALDLDKISRGKAADVPVKANDVIDVPYSGWRIGPYVFYSVVTRIGIGGPAIPY